MEGKQPLKSSALGDLIDTKDILKMVVGKISSQLLLFGVAIIVFLMVSYFVFGPEGIWVFLAILFVFIFASLGYLFAEQKKRIEAGEPEAVRTHLNTKVESISSSNSDFVIDLWTSINKPSAASRDITVIPNQDNREADYRIGEKIKICFRSTKACYLTLLNVGTSGQLTILFPNRVHSDNHIEANKLYEIPGPGYGFDYELQGPPGTEKLKAIATLENVMLVESQFTSDGIFKTASGTAASRDIAVVAQKLQPVAAEKWTEASSQFEVVA